MVLEALRGGTVDLAFATSPIDETEYDATPCFDDHYIFVASPDYGCDFSHAYSLQELTQFPLILLERKASSRRFLEDFFLEHGLKLQPEIELGSHNLLIALARIGLGVAGVTEEFARVGPDSRRHLPAAAERGDSDALCRHVYLKKGPAQRGHAEIYGIHPGLSAKIAALSQPSDSPQPPAFPARRCYALIIAHFFSFCKTKPSTMCPFPRWVFIAILRQHCTSASARIRQIFFANSAV